MSKKTPKRKESALYERSKTVCGRSGRFHGLLHSGARYAVDDVKTAREGIEDNLVISKIAKHAVEDTGGIFASLKGDDQSYADKFVSGCKAASIPVEELDVSKLLEDEPFLTREIKLAFKVPDKVINSFRFITSLLLTAKSEGARIKLNTEMVGFDSDGKTIKGVSVRNRETGASEKISSDLVINASGPWVNNILSGDLGMKKIDMILSAGTMAVVGRRFTESVVNRLRMPSDGDIIVPFFTESIIGTTSFIVEDADKVEIDEDDPKFLLEEGSKMIPAIKKCGVKRYYAGVRPLLSSGNDGNGREASRDFRIFDHASEGVNGIITIGGGKLSTSRLMAENIGDFVCQRTGVKERSKTDSIELLWPDIKKEKLDDLSRKTGINVSVLKELVAETSSKTYSDIYSPVNDIVYSRMLFD